MTPVLLLSILAAAPATGPAESASPNPAPDPETALEPEPDGGEPETVADGAKDAVAATAPESRSDRDVHVHRVLLLTTGPMGTDSLLGARLRRSSAEFAASEFEPLVVALTNPDAALDAQRLDALAQEHDAGAIVVFAPDRTEAELWAFDEQQELSQVAIVVGEAVADDNDAVLAVRLTEILQATLLEVPAAPELPDRPTPPPPEPAPPPPKGPRWAARVGLHAAASAQRVGFMLGPTLGATVALGPRRRFGIDAEAFTTALLGQIEDPAGRASLGIATTRVIAQWWPLPAARFSPGVGAGAGALLAWTRGSATAPFTSQTDVTVVGLPTGAADLAIRLAPQLRLRLGIRVGVALPLIRVQASAATTEVARPLFDGGVALELTPRSGPR